MAYIPKKLQAQSSTPKKTSKKSSKSLSSMVDKDSSTSIRKIENGFIVSESGMKGKGKNKQWYNKEYFSQQNPLEGISKFKFGKKK